MARTRRLAVSIAGLIVIGSIGFLELAQRPRFASFHAVDFVQLLGAGMCYGVALALVGALRKKSAE